MSGGSFGDTLSERPVALIVVDVQAGFISDYTRRCLPRIYELLCSGRFECVIATRFFNKEGSLFRSRIGWGRLSTADEIALDPEVERYADVVIDKPTYGAGQPLIDELERRGIRDVVLVGIDTDVCVLQNAAFLFDQGFRVSVDIAGCATNGGPAADRAAVALLGRTIGRNFVLESEAA